jgi:FkbM family methyltransferase
MSLRAFGKHWPAVVFASTLLLLTLNIVSVSLFSRADLSTEASHFLRTISPPASLFTPKTQARRCQDASPSQFHSQSGEDKYLIENFFKNVCGGSYIEMGALDGSTFSNSFYFNKALSWKGLLVEANPINYAKLIKNRQHELVTPVNAAVCDKEQEIHWVSKGAVGGIVEFASEGFKKTWWNETLIRNADVIKCLPLDQIIRDANLATNGHAFFDFFSLDVEGGEYDVLKAIDFDTLAFGVIFYEVDGSNPLKNVAVRLFLESKGYPFVVNYERSNWHVNTNFASIYENIVHNN